MLESHAPFSDDKPLRGAIVGAGSISVHHLHAWQEIPDVQIVAVADCDHARATARAEEFKIECRHAYANIEDLCDQEDVDFLDIATPPNCHREHVLAAAERGLHILCQKPFAASLAEAEEMIAACEQNQVRCVVNENWRWRGWYRDIKQLILEGRVGRIHSAQFRYYGDEVLPMADGSLPPLLVRQPYTKKLRRLIVFEWGIHLIDVLRFLFGTVNRVSATMQHHSPLVQGEDRAQLKLSFAGGVEGDIDISWSTPVGDGWKMQRGCVDPLVITARQGTIELDPSQDDALILTTDTGQRVLAARGDRSQTEAYQDSFRATQQHFADSLRSGQPAENEASDNYQTLNVMFAAYEAARKGCTIELT